MTLLDFQLRPSRIPSSGDGGGAAGDVPCLGRGAGIFVEPFDFLTSVPGLTMGADPCGAADRETGCIAAPVRAVAGVGGGNGVVAMEPGAEIVIGAGDGADDDAFAGRSGRAFDSGSSVPTPLRAATIAVTIPPVNTPIDAKASQRRAPRRSVAPAPAEPTCVEGARPAKPGSRATRAGSDPTMPLVRCTEIAAWAGDCAYLASAQASSAVF
jgi:hypothetical protein